MIKKWQTAGEGDKSGKVVVGIKFEPNLRFGRRIEMGSVGIKTATDSVMPGPLPGQMIRVLLNKTFAWLSTVTAICLFLLSSISILKR